MRLRIRHLSIKVTTDSGNYGVEIPFTPGLNVLRASNSMGKSTAIQAIIYGLGLEAILSTSQGVPFAHVLTQYLEVGGRDALVTESTVLLEFENEAGSIWTTQRAVKGERHPNLVTVHEGPLLTEGGTHPRQDLYVRRPGAAKNEAGFHRALAEFLGWRLPEVETYDGNLVPLYMETIFPLMFVEQKRGWSDIQARFPTQYRIRDVSLRATEYLLKLDTYELLRKRRSLVQRSTELKQQWESRVESAVSAANSENMRVEGIPALPIAQWPPEGGVKLFIFRSGEWVNYAAIQDMDAAALDRLPKAQRIDNALVLATQESLEDAERALTAVQFAISRKLDTQEQLDLETARLEKRITELESEVRRNKDELVLKQLGSQQNLSIAESHCPTCHQGISDSLVYDLRAEFMTVEENIAFLDEQRKMFNTVLERTRRDLARVRVELAADREEANRIRSTIRALNATLTSPEGTPSAADIESRLTLKDSIERRKRVARRINEIEGALSLLAEEWSTNEAGLAALPKGTLSDSDSKKLFSLEQSVRSQVSEYGMSSISSDTLSINRDTYLPNHEGFNLAFDLSASDLIRTIWAYINGLREVAAQFDTNHLGLLVFDEPKQQDAAVESLAAFLKRASLSIAVHHQVVIATSEPISSLAPMLEGIQASLVKFDGRVITKA